MRNLLIILGAVIAAFVLASCGTVPGMGGGGVEDGYTIHGFVGESTTVAASGATVKLLYGPANEVLDIIQTNYFGKYKFAGLQPGYYKVETGDVTREVMVKDRNIRMDINLSAKDGSMNYAKEGMKDVMNSLSGKGGNGGNAVASGPNDPNLQRQMAGSYFSFSGGGYGSSGGTARNITLCPNGTFSRSSESGYSGDLSGGGSWGAASQGGSDGKWTISGNKMRGTITLFNRDGSQHSFNFEDCSHESGGCFYFDGIKYGWGAPNCR